jgi:hypothetical protein
MPAEEYLQMASDPNVLGDPLLMTQHFIGGTYYEKVSHTFEIRGFTPSPSSIIIHCM